MMIAITLDEEPYTQTRSSLDDGQRTAARDLEEGRHHTLALKQRITESTWTTNPIT
ncbi:hypothetical protein [Streptomyces reniochalinae]|uniref:hypothetical protein n=1 Tax=Streptomyces reniochalinae TaxID=2250578 RepID=UPI0015F07ACC|nr:hypothetical protein [Streptomyces reniochalinae]